MICYVSYPKVPVGDNSGYDPSIPTVVLCHGFGASFSGWEMDAKNELLKRVRFDQSRLIIHFLWTLVVVFKRNTFPMSNTQSCKRC